MYCMTIVLSQDDTGDGAIDEFRELMGPDNDVKWLNTTPYLFP